MNKNGKRKFGKSVLMCGMSGVMAFGMVFAPVSMGASGGATQVKAATTTGVIGPTQGESISGGIVLLDVGTFKGYQKKTTTTTKKPATTSTKKTKLSKNYTKKTTKKSTRTNTKTSYARSTDRNEKIVATTTVTTTTKVYYKKTLTTTVKTQVTIKTTTVNYVRSGSPNIDNYAGGKSANIPNSIIRSFKNDHIKVSLNPNLGVGIAGVFSPTNSSITLKANTDHAFMHEIGHYVNYKKGYVSNSSEFQKIYNAEKSKYKGFYSDIYDKLDNGKTGRSSASEFFAECFRDFYFSSASRERLSRYCPQACAFIADITYNF